MSAERFIAASYLTLMRNIAFELGETRRTTLGDERMFEFLSK